MLCDKGFCELGIQSIVLAEAVDMSHAVIKENGGKAVRSFHDTSVFKLNSYLDIGTFTVLPELKTVHYQRRY